MNRRTVIALALGLGILAAASFAPAARAGNVAWGVSVGVPGFAVSAGQPGYYGGRGYYGAPYRPYYRPWYRPAVVVSPVAYLPPLAYPYYAPAPVVYAPRPITYAYRGYSPAPYRSY
jgi:hypothetical protein